MRPLSNLFCLSFPNRHGVDRIFRTHDSFNSMLLEVVVFIIVVISRVAYWSFPTYISFFTRWFEREIETAWLGSWSS
jgi:hypothetical protein